MNLYSILLLCLTAFLVGFIRNLAWKKNIIFILNIIILESLQPNLPIRNLRFWLPTIIIIITIVSWIITREKEKFLYLDFVKPIGLIILIFLALFVLENFGLFNNLFNQFQFQNIFVFVGILILLVLLWFIKTNGYITNFWIFTIIILFVVLKTPQLTLMLSKWLRSKTNQSVALADQMDISWFGFSYIAFRLIHTLRDHKTGRLPDVDLVGYINYITFFPTVTAGPIDRLDHFQNTFLNPYSNLNERIILGAKRIFLGFFKKFVIANLLSMVALNNINATQIRSAIWMWISIYAYAFLIYFDFSGYTDIAIGMALLMGIDVPENFSHPYLKKNLTMFWNSWHITLTQFFRTYFFNPVTRYLRTGRRKWKVWLIILTTQISTMVLIGLWHGIIMNFIIWGLWHGMGLFIQNRWSNSLGARIKQLSSTKLLSGILYGANLFLTFNFVAVGWVFFVMPKAELSIIVLKKLVGAG